MFNKITNRIRIISGNPVCSTPPEFLHQSILADVYEFHKSVDGYKATPLVKLICLAKKLGIAGIYVKDESYRFGLNSFKSLGGIYAVAEVICRELKIEDGPIDFHALTSPQNLTKIKDMVFVTATDGNHGKGIAWAASKFGCRAVVFMPAGSKEYRAEAIRSINNAEVVITDYNYDDTVLLAAKHAEENGWFLVQDTGWDGYEEIPKGITQGYTTMVSETIEQLKEYGETKPSHVFLQAGVGSMAGGVLGYLANLYDGSPPLTTIVEPDTAACIFESAAAGDGKPHIIGGNPETIMAGLNCGSPNIFTWPILRDFASFYASCPDWVSSRGMRILGNPVGSDERIISGESGAVGLGLLSLLMEKNSLSDTKDRMGLNQDSVVLLFSTEGNTDPDGYNEIVYDGKMPTPYTV